MKKLEDEFDKEIQAKCPLCGELHTLIMYWTGSSTPRIYCPQCKAKLAGKSIPKKGRFLFPSGQTLE